MFTVHFLTGGKLLFSTGDGAIVTFDPSSNATEELVPANVMVRPLTI